MWVAVYGTSERVSGEHDIKKSHREQNIKTDGSEKPKTRSQHTEHLNNDN